MIATPHTPEETLERVKESPQTGDVIENAKFRATVYAVTDDGYVGMFMEPKGVPDCSRISVVTMDEWKLHFRWNNDLTINSTTVDTEKQADAIRQIEIWKAANSAS